VVGEVLEGFAGGEGEVVDRVGILAEDLDEPVTNGPAAWRPAGVCARSAISGPMWRIPQPPLCV
jgi:hypothetical protein